MQNILDEQQEGVDQLFPHLTSNLDDVPEPTTGSILITQEVQEADDSTNDDTNADGKKSLDQHTARFTDTLSEGAA